jgi:hypothetical protein
MADLPDTTELLPAQRRRRIPPPVRAAVDAYVSGRAKNLTAAAKAAGISREYLSRSLSLPHVAEFLRQKAARVVAMGAGRAAARIMELIDADSEHVSFDASKHVLSIAGIKPTPDANVNFNLEVRAGYVIDLTRRGDETPLRIVSPISPAPAVTDDESTPAPD